MRSAPLWVGEACVSVARGESEPTPAPESPVEGDWYTVRERPGLARGYVWIKSAWVCVTTAEVPR